ncbi:hypothetical protein CEUSTIGMA_g3203.t1 [Chlamydomonas eustigma]|uniref:Bifunctional lysine-specific demethylase and histidyl-hydroxylase n=1 Tax=Chlamydomonas eustigma TaxID=1157962 RepID=A0A250WZ28_9CHLO|nr:hypothetical protein CEUSTIGMA_g3203.t1 [Chlamydomonas eustigma]|eukprot:GAX75760.1 hypothetical protein CEUSTIGMA_g3203.t1 [Chlamydomonas eustigma]
MVANKSKKQEKPPSPSLGFDPIGFLMDPFPSTKFETEHWEKSPLHARGTEEKKSFLTNLFNLDSLKEVARERLMKKEDEGDEEEEGEEEEEEEDGPLLFGQDVNAARYLNGSKEVPEEEEASEENITALFQKGYTMQVLQPQRYSDGIWHLVSAMEKHLGCLVGCNAYITPAKTQGLAPHHDDVELWICQTQGTKRWKLYAPLAGFELPNKPSQDLPQEMIGEPIMDITLKVGDVLYLPRGTIHQAVAQEGGSTHLTLSTYQNWTWGNFASTLIHTALEGQGEVEGVALPIELRKSLPKGFLGSTGLQAEIQGRTGSGCKVGSRTAAATLAAGLRALADQLEEEEEVLLPAAADAFAADFIRNRIRPHPALLPDQGPPPMSLDDSVIGRGEGLFMIVPVDGPDDPTVPEGFVKLCTPVMNSRYYHMMRVSDADAEEDEGNSDEDDDHGEDASHHHHHGHDHVHDGCCGHKHSKGGSHDNKGEDEGGEHEDSEDEDDEDDEDDGTGLPGPLTPASYAPLVADILSCTSAPGIKLRSMVEKAPHCSEEEVLRLAFSLWRNGFVRTIPATSKTKGISTSKGAQDSKIKCKGGKGEAQTAVKEDSKQSHKSKTLKDVTRETAEALKVSVDKEPGKRASTDDPAVKGSKKSKRGAKQ